MCSQEQRGGGALCKIDTAMWTAFDNAIATLEPCYLKNPCTGSSSGACYWCNYPASWSAPTFSPALGALPTTGPVPVPVPVPTGAARTPRPSSPSPKPSQPHASVATSFPTVARIAPSTKPSAALTTPPSSPSPPSSSGRTQSTAQPSAAGGDGRSNQAALSSPASAPGDLIGPDVYAPLLGALIGSLALIGVLLVYRKQLQPVLADLCARLGLGQGHGGRSGGAGGQQHTAALPAWVFAQQQQQQQHQQQQSTLPPRRVSAFASSSGGGRLGYDSHVQDDIPAFVPYASVTSPVHGRSQDPGMAPWAQRNSLASPEESASL